jgi:PAS domain S-box-containing protein
MGIHMYHLEPGNRLIFIGANRAADNILGVDNSIFIGKTIEQAFPALADSEIPGKYRRAAEFNESWQTEQVEYHEGEIAGAFEVYAFQTQPNAMAAMFLEITPRKKAEEDLRRLRNLLSNIVNSMPSILIGVNLEGRVTQWNREAEKETGIPPEKATGKMLTDLFPQLEREMENVKAAIKNKTPQKDEKFSLENKDGRTRFTDITVYPLVTNGVEGAVIRLDDVTERVRIEEMMIQSEKMVSVGGLAAGMAHEINNPLAGILQNAQVMSNRFQLNLPRNRLVAEECGATMEVIRAYAEKRNIDSMLAAIIESGQRAAKIVQNMLSFSRKSESKLIPSSMARLLDKTVELASNDYDLKKKYDFRRIRICREYEDGIPELMCESTKIQQVFLNLLKNGAQAMVEDHPTDPRFTLRVKAEDGWVRVEVEDNGPGMDEETRKRVFEPFFTTKDTGIGTGLGLSVSYFIVTENHKGTMSVESSPGKGATFIIRLPLHLETWQE